MNIPRHSTFKYYFHPAPVLLLIALILIYRYMAVKSQNEQEKPVIDTPIVNISTMEPIFDRKKLLEITSSTINEIYERVSGDRFRVRDGDKERIAYLKLLKELVSLQTLLLEKSKAPVFDGVPKVFVDTRTPEEKERDRRFTEHMLKKSNDLIELCMQE
mgnify:CR=1 FL=1